MIGKLIKKKNCWVIEYEDMTRDCEYSTEVILLHPEDEKLMVFRGQLPNEQHILDGKDVLFDIVSLEDGVNPNGDIIHKDYAKLNVGVINTARYNTNPTITNEKHKILLDALNDIKNWDDDLQDEWGDCGYRASAALEEFDNQNK
jgi:hypothetical protein